MLQWSCAMYKNVFGKFKVRSSVLAEANSKARWSRRSFVGYMPTADQYRKRKLNDLRCQLSVFSFRAISFFLALAIASGSKSLRKILKLNSIISNNSNNLFLFK